MFGRRYVERLEVVAGRTKLCRGKDGIVVSGTAGAELVTIADGEIWFPSRRSVAAMMASCLLL